LFTVAPVRCLDKRWTRSYRTDVPHECFADEIAIDFPSVGHVVERIRDSFLGEPPRRDVLTTELRLSRTQASYGLVVPLEVPIRGTCPTCGGRGESWTEPCHPCCGTGESLFHHPVRLAVPAGVTDGTCFRFRVSSPYAASVHVEVRVAVQPAAV
jgi:hypothetical protein